MSRMNGISQRDAVAITDSLIDEGFAANRSEASRLWWCRSRRYINDVETGNAKVVSHFAVEDLKRRLDDMVAQVPAALPRVERVRQKVAVAEEVGRFLARTPMTTDSH